MGKPEIEKRGEHGGGMRYKVKPGLRYADEEKEGTMLHTKAIVQKNIQFGNFNCFEAWGQYKARNRRPEGTDDEVKNPSVKTKIFVTECTCYPVPKLILIGCHGCHVP